MVSMKEIAKQCNVSVATVSKALNGYSDIGEETKNYILRTASEMGYLPNSSARALKTKRTFNLGVLFVDEARSGLTHDYFNRVLESFKSTAEAKGYDITFTSGNVSGKRMTYLEHCRYRGGGRSGNGLCGFHCRRGSGASPFRHSGGDHRSYL